MAKTVMLSKSSNSTAELYDTVREASRIAGKEKAFIAEFGTKEEFLAKCHVQEVSQ